MRNMKKILPLLLALCLLLTAVLLPGCEKPEEPPVTPPADDPELPPFGTNIGNRCYSADVALLGKPEETFNPANNKGKVTVINFWGTWCGPCKSELPAFDQLAADYADKVTVFAVHSSDEQEEPVSYVAEKFPDSKIVFGRDTDKDMFYYLMGGNGYWPITVILDGDGVIRDRHVGGLSHEELKAAVDDILA